MKPTRTEHLLALIVEALLEIVACLPAYYSDCGESDGWWGQVGETDTARGIRRSLDEAMRSDR